MVGVRKNWQELRCPTCCFLHFLLHQGFAADFSWCAKIPYPFHLQQGTHGRAAARSHCILAPELVWTIAWSSHFALTVWNPQPPSSQIITYHDDFGRIPKAQLVVFYVFCFIRGLQQIFLCAKIPYPSHLQQGTHGRAAARSHCILAPELVWTIAWSSHFALTVWNPQPPSSQIIAYHDDFGRIPMGENTWTVFFLW